VIQNQAILSVVIPTYNRPEILGKTLDYLDKQNTNIEFEVIVVDDCSTIPLPDFGFGKGKRVNWKLLRNEKNVGRAATRNRGIRESRGEYILMIDDDVWASPGLLQAHYQAQQRIGGGVVVGSIPVSAEVINNVWNDFYRQRFGALHDQMMHLKDNLSHWYFFTGNVSVPKLLIEEAGLFDESFRNYGSEDSELGYRLWRNGVRMVYEVGAMAEHFNEETMESLLRKRESWGRSHLLLAMKHPELAKEVSVAGILAPGRTYYQIFIRRPFLIIGGKVCLLMATMNQPKLCLFFLKKISLAYYALGMIEAIKDFRTQKI
jgi:glycosyltransferase involved in cell wall biosynthesis